MADNGVVSLTERPTNPSPPSTNIVNIYVSGSQLKLQTSDGSVYNITATLSS